MSGHLRCSFAVFVVLAGGSMSPAFSNPFDVLFSAAPAEAPATPPVEEECLPHPGKATADGQHWVYRYDGHRKCWFQAAEETATTMTKPVHHHAIKRRDLAAEKNEVVPRQRKAVADARAELPGSTPAETSQPAPPAPEFKLADAAVAATGAAAPASIVADRVTNQLTPDHPALPHVDVERLLAAAPAESNAVAASIPMATENGVSGSKAGDNGRGWNATWLGVLLITLGLVSLLSSSRALWVAVEHPSRGRDRRKDGGRRTG
jgi:hypothetical protein